LPNFLIIQKPDRQFSVRGFAAALKPEPFNGTFYIRRARMILWLTAMNCYHAAQGKSEQFTPEEESSFEMVDNLFRGAVISALDAKYIDSYITHTLLQRSCGMHWMLNLVFLMLGSELYLMKQLFYYKMVEDCFVVEQAHEVQSLAK
jgi:hypothetical protein